MHFCAPTDAQMRVNCCTNVRLLTHFCASTAKFHSHSYGNGVSRSWEWILTVGESHYAGCDAP